MSSLRTPTITLPNKIPVTPFGTEHATRTIRRTSRQLHGVIQPTTGSDSDENVVSDAIKDSGLLNTTWKAYKVSPMYNLKTEKQNLVRYGRALSAQIEAERRKGIAIGLENSNQTLSTSFKLMHELRGHEGEPAALNIQILSKERKTKKGDNVVLLSAFLLSYEIPNEVSEILGPSFTFYPLLLIHSTLSLTQQLLHFLKTQFDCCISPRIFSSTDLKWKIGQWSGFVPDSTKRPVQLTYNIPNSANGINQITLNLNTQDCKDVWDRIFDMESGIVTKDQIHTFMSAIEEHFYSTFKINLAALNLSRIGTPIVFIGNEGKLKIFSKKHAANVLRDICFEHWEYTSAVCDL